MLNKLLKLFEFWFTFVISVFFFSFLVFLNSFVLITIHLLLSCSYVGTFVS